MAFSFKKFWAGLTLDPKSTSTSDSQGDFEVLSTDGKARYHNGTSNSPVVTEAHTATLENKNLDDGSVGFVDISDPTVAIFFDAAGTTGTDTTIQSSQTANRIITLPDADGTVALTSDLTNKVSGPASATDEAVARFDGVTGKLIQNSVVTITDAGTVAGATQLNVDNLRLDGNTVSSTNANGAVTIAPNGTGQIEATSVKLTVSQGVAFTEGLINSSGSNVAVSADPAKHYRANNGSLVSIDTLAFNVGTPTSGQEVTIQNVSGASFTINNLTGAATTRQINTGTGGNLIIEDGDSVQLKYNSVESKWYVIASTFKGPATSVDNTVPKFDGTDGQKVSASGVSISDLDVLSGATQINVDNLRLDGNTISNTGGTDIILDPETSEKVRVAGSFQVDEFLGFETTYDSTTTGSAVFFSPVTKTTVFSNAGLVSIEGITPNIEGEEVTFINLTGNSFSLLTTAGVNHIRSADSVDIIVENESAITLVWSITDGYWYSSSITGIAGPISSTDEALVRWDGTTGKAVQNSVITATDAGIIAGVTQLNVDNLRLDGNVVSSTDVNGNIDLTPNGTGLVNTNKNARFIQNIAFNASNDAATGANQTLSTTTTKYVRLTAAGTLTSVDMIPAGTQGQELVLINLTGAPVSLNNETGGTAANRILTGTGAAVSLADNASIPLTYDTSEARWMVTAGTGGGGSGSLDTIFQLTGSDIATWATGDNATFLGGGTISGTFASDTSTPLQGTASYLYTQAAGSLNDYMASPTQSVDIRFRGSQATLYFPYMYNGTTGDIRVIFYDVTAGAEIPSSVFISAATTPTIFRTNITIPSTCANIRVGFQTVVLNSGKILEFDSVSLTADTTIMAPLADQTQSLGWTRAINSTTIDFASGTTLESSGGGLFTVSGSSLTAIKECVVIGTLRYSGTGTAAATATGYTVTISTSTGLVSGGRVQNQAALSLSHHGTLSAHLLPGQTMSFGASSTNVTTTDQNISITAQGINQNILTAPETFSTDTASLAYASSAAFTLATLPNSPIGTFITFTYAINGNVRTQTTTAPTQTTADMNLNGIQIFTRPYNAASTAGNPVMVAIQIGKGLKGKSLEIFKATSKVNAGNTDRVIYSTTLDAGFNMYSYNESTGVLIVDAGGDNNTTTTSRFINFGDATTQSNGYLVINASKNPALTGLNINRIYSESISNAGQALTANVTNIPFIGVTDTNGAWNGTQYTVPESGVYSLSGKITFSAALAVNISLYIDAVADKIMNENDSKSIQNIQITKYFTKGQVLSLRSSGAATLVVSTVGHYLVITKTNVG